MAALAQSDLAKHRQAAEVTAGLLRNLVQRSDQLRTGSCAHPSPASTGDAVEAVQEGTPCLHSVPALGKVTQFLKSLTVPAGSGTASDSAPTPGAAPAAGDSTGAAGDVERAEGLEGGHAEGEVSASESVLEGAQGAEQRPAEGEWSAGGDVLERAKADFQEHLDVALLPAAPSCPQTLCKFTAAEDR